MFGQLSIPKGFISQLDCVAYGGRLDLSSAMCESLPEHVSGVMEQESSNIKPYLDIHGMPIATAWPTCALDCLGMKDACMSRPCQSASSWPTALAVVECRI